MENMDRQQRGSKPFILQWNLFVLATLALSAQYLTACGVQSIPRALNQVEAAQAEITNQYKRRADLVPNLVNVVKGYASHEQETLTKVTEARAKATSLNVTLEDAESLKRYQQAQGELSQALGRLLAISENYPDLKANQNFKELQVQLEGTENRITVARTRAIDSIRAFNDLITVFPTSLTNSLLFHHKPLPQYGSDLDAKELEKAPDVTF
jgi:LemA protein